MIRNHRHLTPEGSPKELVHRDGELDAITTALDPITDGYPGEAVLISGPTGVGKTTVAKEVVDRLMEATFDVRFGYVNCITRSSPGSLLNKVCRDAGVGNALTVEATPVADYYETLETCEDQIVVILDEAGFAEDDSVLAALYDTHGVTPIYITTDIDTMLAGMDSRTADRVRSSRSVHLERYSHGALVDILRNRASVALAPGALADSVLERCADVAAGNARHALTLLLRSVRHVNNDGRARVTPADVEAIVDDARAELYKRRVKDLGSHQRVLFDIVRRAYPDAVDAGDIHDLYKAAVESPRSTRTRRRYLNGLESYELIESRGSTRDREYVCTVPMDTPTPTP